MDSHRTNIRHPRAKIKKFFVIDGKRERLHPSFAGFERPGEAAKSTRTFTLPNWQ
jgi:hypothetical protein